MSPAEARAAFYQAVQGSRLDMADYDNNPARRKDWEATLEQEEAKASTHETARDYLTRHITPEQEAETAAFLESLPEPEGTLAEVFARAELEAAMNDEEGRALVQAIHQRKADA